MAKLYEYITPKSEVDSAYEDFEYLIRWIGRDGGEYLYLFYDALIIQTVENNIINQEDENRVEALINRERKDIELTADDLSLTDLQVIGEMFANKYVTRVRKDGTEERLALGSNRLRYQKTQGRYEVKINVTPSDLPNIK